MSRQRQELLLVGFDASAVVEQTRILGVDFCSKLNTGQRHTAQQRLQEAHLVAKKICKAKSLPVKTKHMLWQTRVVPKATWGLFFHVPKMTQLQVCFRNFMFSHKLGAPDLQKILYGHRADLAFMAGFSACCALRQVMLKGMMAWEHRPSRGTWQNTVRIWLRNLGWNEVAPWHWAHNALGYDMRWMQLIPLQNAEFSKKLSTFDHWIRESWRCNLFNSWLNTKRRDAMAVRQNARYDEERCKMTRTMFEACNSHGKAVLVGAACSTAFYQKVKHGGIVQNFCHWCQSSLVPSWDHLCWQCSFFRATRPAAAPQDLLQRRLAWPSLREGSIYNDSVLAHMAYVRATVIDKD